MSANILFQAFAGGEITPELFGRLDLGKYQTGLALARNWMILPHGPAQTRPGTLWVNECWDSTRKVRLIPFSFSATDTMLLEFGHQYIRFHTQGGTLLEAAKPIVAKIVGPTCVVDVIGHLWNVGDTVWSDEEERFYRIATVISVDRIHLQLLSGAETTALAIPPYGTLARVYTIASPYFDHDLPDIHYTQSADVLTLSHPVYPNKELRRAGVLAWSLVDVSFAPTLAAPAAPALVNNGPGGGTPIAHEYVITAVASDGLEESGASLPAGAAAIDLAVAGNTISISASAPLPTTVVRINVYKKQSGLHGYIGQTAAAGTFIDDNITPDMTKTPPEASIALNNALLTYPSAVAYHEQRRVFAATDAEPQLVVMTRPGTESNITTSIPSQDDDAISIRIKANQHNRIRHLVSFGDLIAFTYGAIWRIHSGDAPVITPTTISAKNQGGPGANTVQPALAANAILYVQAKGSHVRELAFNNDKGGFVSTDMSIMSSHLFDRFTLVDLAYTSAPLAALWAVRSDGVLLCMTYVPEHQVFAWHQHVTDGSFESVAVVAEGNEDALYCVVSRVVDGRTVRNIERMGTRLISTGPEAFCVDSGVTKRYTIPATGVTNLHHLEGKTVSILADGAVKAQQLVVNGSIVIDYPASVIHVGLQFVADLVTLPVSMMGQRIGAGGIGTRKNVNGVHLRTLNATGLRIGPDFDRLTPLPQRSTSVNYGQPPELRAELRHVVITPSWGDDAAVCFRQDDPVPATILAIALDMATGG